MGRKYPAASVTVHATSEPRIVRLAPYVRASRPMPSAPATASTWTIRTAVMSVDWLRPSSSEPYTDAWEITVWMPSL